MSGILPSAIITIGILVFGIFFLIKKRKDNKKKTGSYGFGCLITIIVVIGLLATVGIVAYNGYKEAEIRSDIKKAQAIYLSNIKNYKNFSNREAKELSIKLFLLDACEGGQKKLETYYITDSSVKSSACHELLRLNIKKENLPSSKTELEIIKYLNTVNFGKALDNYQNFINESKKETNNEINKSKKETNNEINESKKETNNETTKVNWKCISGDCYTGSGILVSNNSDRYEGIFKWGKFHGKGVLTYADGHKYSGDFKIGYYHGIGIETFVNGSIYSGGFKKGEPHGEIIQTFADGAKFEGTIDSETGVSKGVYIYADGKIEKGTWENDKLIKSE